MAHSNRDPNQVLAEAIGSLERLNAIHARSKLATAHIEQVESILSAALDPDQLFLYDPKTARPTR